MSTTPTPLPEAGTTVHFCLAGGGGPVFICHPAIIVQVEDGSELGPDEAPRPHMVHLAVIVPDGRRGEVGGIHYAPLSAPDFDGSWHHKHEHTPAVALTPSDTLMCGENVYPTVDEA